MCNSRLEKKPDFGCESCLLVDLRERKAIPFSFAHALAEDKDNAVKGAFNAKFKLIYDKWPDHNAEIVLGDFNGEVELEWIFSPTLRQLSVHDKITFRCDAKQGTL